MSNFKVIPNFEQTIFSIARFSGSCKINGQQFLVSYPRKGEESKFKSALIRQDLIKNFTKLRETKSFDEILTELEKL